MVIMEKYCYKCQNKKDCNDFYDGTSICISCKINIETTKYHFNMEQTFFKEMQQMRRMEKYYRRLKEQYKIIYLKNKKSSYSSQ